MLGVGASSLAAVGWGSAGVIISLTTVTGLVVSFWRMWLGAAMLAAVLVARGRRPTLRMLRESWLGGVLLGADMMMFFTAVKLSGVAVPTVIGALQPALVMTMAWLLLGDRIARRDIAWTVVAVGGVVVIALGAGAPSSRQGAGDLLAVGSLLAWSGYFIAAKRAQPRIAALEYTTGVTVVAACASWIPILVTRSDLGSPNLADWGWLLVLAAVPSTAHLLMNWAHQHLEVSIASLIGSANPIVAAVLAYVVLGQSLTWLQILGGVMGIGAITVVAVGQGRAVRPAID